MGLGGTVRSSVWDVFMDMPVRNPVGRMSVVSGTDRGCELLVGRWNLKPEDWMRPPRLPG